MINTFHQLNVFVDTAKAGDVAHVRFFAQEPVTIVAYGDGVFGVFEGEEISPSQRGDVAAQGVRFALQASWRASLTARVKAAAQALPPKGIEVAARLARAYGHAWGVTPAAAALIAGGNPAVYLPLAEVEADPTGIIASDAVRGEDPASLYFGHQTLSGRLVWRITAAHLRMEVHRPSGLALAVEVNLQAHSPGFVRPETSSVRLEKGEVDVHERHVEALSEALRATNLFWEQDPEWVELEAALWALVKPEPEAEPEPTEQPRARRVPALGGWWDGLPGEEAEA